MVRSESQQPLLLEVRNLKTHYFLDEGIVRAVDGASLTVRRGQTVGVVGESGCGKSVMARSIIRIVAPPGRVVDGEIFYHRPGGEVMDLVKLDPRSATIRSLRGADISMVFQEPMTSFSPVHTIGDQIGETIVLHQNASQEEAREGTLRVLELVGMPRPASVIDRYPYQLSGGMRQRAMIAMALSCRPNLLIADEPTTALDVTTQAQILTLMRNLQHELGMAILFITHDLGVIAQMTEHVVVMYMGKVVESTDVVSLFHAPKHPYTQALLRSIPRLDIDPNVRLQAIRGSVPDPYSIPLGCPFHPRCPFNDRDRCIREAPELREVSPGSFASCHYAGEINLSGASATLAIGRAP